jgi:TolB-like protein/Tfp pilus assembly protein PilF
LTDREIPAQSRRLAAILVADVVGYSSLIERDETGTLTALDLRWKNVVEPLVTEYSGRIVKFTGDGVLAEFASAVRAVSCALRLQERMAEANGTGIERLPIVLRIGVNLGDVVSQGSDIFGDGVNVAARLETLAEPGSIFISGKVYDEVIGKIAFAGTNLGDMPLKNIARPVRVWKVTTGGGQGITHRQSTSPRDKPSVAVLPFVNMSGDAENQFLADGLTEDITTALSRSVTLSVIARTSSFAYKGRTADIKRIPRELDVGYVLEGSVRKAGNRIRVTAQLIDAESSSHAWAEKFDAHVDDVFDIQDQITRSVAASTHTEIFSSGGGPRALQNIYSPAYRLALQAGHCLFQMTSTGFARGAALAEEALALDPDCAMAHRMRANAYVVRLATSELQHSPENIERALSLTEEVLRRSPRDEWSHWLMALALCEAGHFEEAVAQCDIGLEINPNASMILGDKGDYLVMLGRADEAIQLCRLALRLNPRDPIGYWWENSVATAHFVLDEFELALDLSRRVALRKPDHVRAAIMWTASAGALERLEESRDALDRCQARFPGITLQNVMPHYTPAFRRAEDRDKLLRALRAGGMPA